MVLVLKCIFHEFTYVRVRRYQISSFLILTSFRQGTVALPHLPPPAKNKPQKYLLRLGVISWVLFWSQAFFSFFLVVINLIFPVCVTFSIVFLRTELFTTLKKPFSKSFFAFFFLAFFSCWCVVLAKFFD